MRLQESQIEIRQHLDEEALERSYAELAASVSAKHKAPMFRADDLEMADGAVLACLRHCGAKPGNVPDDSLTDINERLDYLCRPSGTMHRDIRLNGTWYKDAIGAMLGKLDTGESIALLPGAMGGYVYQEPGTGAKVKVTKAVAAHIQEEAVLFYRPLPQGALTVRDLLLFLARVFDMSDYFFVVAAAAVTTLVGFLPAWANKLAFGTVVPSGQVDLIIPLGALLLGVSLSSTLLGICRSIVMNRVTTKLKIASEAATFSRVLLLPTSFFKEYASGNLASRVSQVTSLMQMLTSMFLGSGLTVVFSLAYLGQIAVLAPSLVAPAFAIALLQAVLTIVATLISSRRQRKVMEASAGLSGLVTALLNGVQKIKLAGAENRAFSKWAHAYSTYSRAAYNQPVLERALPVFVSLIGMMGSISIFYLAGSRGMTLADYMSFNVAYGQVSGAVMGLASIAAQLAQIPPMLEMVKPVLEATPEMADDKPSVGTLNGSIEVSNVSFRYTDNSPYVLHNISLKIRSGEYVAIVGKSGCGKSTLMRLMLGFEKPERGNIFYGPYDVSKVDLRSLRQSIGTVMQDGKLFMGDIASNITIASPGATLDDAWAAAEISGIADDIRRMPMGMQTILSEGAGGVSGGQRQRIMIARAVCGKRRILMLDEATSALDNVTQKHVADSLEQLKCTRVVVAHRLSTVRHCDRILVVDAGRIVEEGTYEELIAKGGFFADLVARQRIE